MRALAYLFAILMMILIAFVFMFPLIAVILSHNYWLFLLFTISWIPTLGVIIVLSAVLEALE